MNEFRSSEVLFGRINKFLSSFGSSGEIDENDWYHYVKDVLIRLNIPATSIAETVLEVNEYRATLPSDFHQLWSVWLGEGDNKEERIQRKHHQDKLIFYYEDTCLKKGECAKSLVPADEPNVIMRDIYIEEDFAYREKYKNVQLLKLVNRTTSLCHKDCYNKFIDNEYTFSINNNSLRFNFKNGHVLLQYFAFQKDEDGLPLIPNDVRIEDAIEAYIEYKELQKMFINGMENVLQRMQYMEAKYEQKYKEAKDHTHLPTWKSMVEYAYKNQHKHDKYIIDDVRSGLHSWWYKPIPYVLNNFSNWNLK